MANNFSYKSYKNSVIRYLNSGYKFTTFSQFDDENQNKKVLMRHDIDFDVKPAYKLAQLENQIGISSTYFFRVTAKNYNILSKSSIEDIESIKNKGHEIGLHLDHKQIQPHSNDIGLILNIKKLLERELDVVINSFSIHEPSRTSLEVDGGTLEKLELKHNAYDKKYFKDIKYISDSGGRWREGHFDDWLDRVDQIQILTHPLWWYESSPQENY